MDWTKEEKQMGETVIEKIIRNNVGHAVKPGDIVTVNVDRVMIHDIFIPFVAEKFEEMGFQKLWDPDKVVLIYDHLVPASQLDDTRHFHEGDAFAEKYGMKNVHRSDGICHQLMTEAGYVKPGNIVFGTDSHTTTYGCVGAFSSASMMGALAVDLLIAGKTCRVVGYRHGEFVDFDINEALAMQKGISDYQWEVCQSLSHNYDKNNK